MMKLGKQCVTGNALLGLLDRKYIRKIEGAEIFSNKRADAIAQIAIARKVKEYVSGGSNRKALLIALDAVRSDALLNILASKNKKYPFAEDSLFSGIQHLKTIGTLSFSYTGGDVNRKETLQEASTIPGFSTLFTGEWADKHKVYTNNDGFKITGETILMSLAKEGKRVSFHAQWDAFFACLLKNDVEQGLCNYTFYQEKSDYSTYVSMKSAIERGDHLVFGILDNADNSGHAYGFNNRNPAYVKAVVDCDRYAYDLVKCAESREEDWLIIITTDHGGHDHRHGTTRMSDTTTFIASNKKID